MKEKTEKVFISRDEVDKRWVYVWRKPKKGNWSPTKMKDCESVIWERDGTEDMDIYHISDFKKKFGITIPPKIKKCVFLPYNLVHNED